MLLSTHGTPIFLELRALFELKPPAVYMSTYPLFTCGFVFAKLRVSRLSG